MNTNEGLVTQAIGHKIYLIRQQKVMLDSDLAELYGVSTRDLNKAVSRNLSRFPEDFRFKLSTKEVELLRLHIATSREDKNLMFQIGTSSWGGRRKPTTVFTEQGVAMLSSVLRSCELRNSHACILNTNAK